MIEDLEEKIHPWTSFLVLPLFALANAGVCSAATRSARATEPRSRIGVALALIVGKLIGISGATALALRLKLGVLPKGVDLRSVFGIAALGGIGFTVSLFIASLSFDEPLLVDSAKIGILAGSVVSAAVGVAILALPGGSTTRRRK